MSDLAPTDILTAIAGTLVAKNKYTSREEALRALALAVIRSKMAYYRRRIRRLERKHHTNLDRFTARLKGRATPGEEDDWFEWRSAGRMLADWHQAYEDLCHARAR